MITVKPFFVRTYIPETSQYDQNFNQFINIPFIFVRVVIITVC